MVRSQIDYAEWKIFIITRVTFGLFMLKKILNSTAKIAVALAALVALVMLNFYLWKKDHSQEQEIRALQNELALQQQENAKIAKTNGDLRQRIDSLKRGGFEMIEEEARNGFGMVGKGETFYHFEEKEGKPIKRSQ